MSSAVLPPEGPLVRARTVGATYWMLVAWLCLIAGLAAVLAFFHLAWWWGSVPLPLTAVLLPALLWPMAGALARLTGSVLATALPWLSALVVAVFCVTMSNAPLYGLPVRVVSVDHDANTATDGDWRLLLFFGLLLLAGFAQVVLVRATRPPTPGGAAPMEADAGAVLPEDDEPATGVTPPTPPLVDEPRGSRRPAVPAERDAHGVDTGS